MAERTFEARLAEALTTYADRLPVDVDALAVATVAAAGGRPSRWTTTLAGLRTTSRRVTIVLAALLLLLALVIAALVGSRLIHPPPPLPPSVLGYTVTGSMTVFRPLALGVALADGRVLVVGGHTPDLGGGFVVPYATAELFDPDTGRWSRTGPMTVPRLLFAATVLADGRVLVEGGDPTDGATASAEVFDPRTGAWTETGAMVGPRRQHTATLLPDDTVLVAGGTDHEGNPLATAELYDPTTGVFRPTGSLPSPRFLQGAAGLPDGTVLLAGGLDAGDNPTATAVLYDPRTRGFKATGSLAVPSVGPVLVPLQDGSILVLDGGVPTAERYDPADGTFRPTGTMAAPHTTATVLHDGRVLVAGGAAGTAAELYDPSSRTFSPTLAEHSAARVLAATLLPSGQVLLVRGGGDPSELFDPDHPQPTAPAIAPAGSGPPSPPDACSLLTTAEVSAIRGVAAGPGDPGNGSPSAPDCVWRPETGAGDDLLEIALVDDDPDVWASLVASPEFGDASAIGRTALIQGGRGGGLWVEADGYIVHIQPTNPVPGGSSTPALPQQLRVLERILSRLR